MSSETGEATDFIVVMSDEPQGGLKSRAAEIAASRRRSYDDEEDEPRWRGFYHPEQPSFFGFW